MGQDEVGEIPSNVDDFLAALESVPWFSRVGEPTPADARVVRMLSWDDWPGRDDPAVGQLFSDIIRLFDQIVVEAANDHPVFELTRRVHDVVSRRIRERVPHELREDPRHAPSMAACHAEEAAKLVAMCLQTGRDVPADLREQWNWFARGHWPAGYASLDDPGWLLVF